MYLAHNEGTSLVAETFITANDNSKSYFGYLNTLVDEYNNTYHHYIAKKAINSSI